MVQEKADTRDRWIREIVLEHSTLLLSFNDHRSRLSGVLSVHPNKVRTTDPHALILQPNLHRNDACTRVPAVPGRGEMASDMEAMANLRFGFEIEAEERGEQAMLFSLVKNGDLSVEKTAKTLNLSADQFLKRMAEAEDGAIEG